MALFKVIGRDVLFDREYVLRNLIIPKPEHCPRIILLYGPCRSGTTALFKSFSEVVPVSYYQPIKNIMRYGEPQLFIENTSTIFIKETIGPWREAECSFNPWEILLEAGVPKEKLSLIPIPREPVKTYDSWLRTFENVDIERFLQSYKNLIKTYELALEMDIEAYPTYYEKLEWSPNRMMQDLMEKLNLNYQKSVVDWRGENAEIPQTAHISQKLQRDRINDVISVKGLKYFDRPVTNISQRDKEMIKSQLSDLYSDYVDNTDENLINCSSAFVPASSSHLATSSR